MHQVWLYLVQEKLTRVIHVVTTTQFNHPIKGSSETATGQNVVTYVLANFWQWH